MLIGGSPRAQSATQPPAAGQVGAADPASAPLPDLTTFEADVKARLRTDRALQAQYTFLERTNEIQIGKLGKVSVGATKLYEVYPSPDPGNTYKRLLAVNGTPISAAELARNDAKHRQDVEDRLNESPVERARRAREAADDLRQEHEDIEEIFRLYDIRLVRRETLNGYPTVVGTLEPRPQYRPRTDDGRMMKRFRARVWVHEQDFQVVKVDLEAVEDVTLGWGVIGRLHKGARITLERRKVNGEVWLPARMCITGTGRSLIFRSFDIDAVTDWSDYKKFGVKTDETFSDR